MKPSEIPAYVAELQERVLEKDTPYNTYVVDGLPPTPIANPGRAALEAVANPSRTNDLYFIADGTGGHAFAETLEDHKRNITRWQRVRAGQQQTEESAAPAITPRPVPTTSFPGRVEKRTDRLVNGTDAPPAEAPLPEAADTAAVEPATPLPEPTPAPVATPESPAMLAETEPPATAAPLDMGLSDPAISPGVGDEPR